MYIFRIAEALNKHLHIFSPFTDFTDSLVTGAGAGACLTGSWGAWSGCSVTCGKGINMRSRVYADPGQVSGGHVSCHHTCHVSRPRPRVATSSCTSASSAPPRCPPARPRQARAEHSTTPRPPTGNILYVTTMIFIEYLISLLLMPGYQTTRVPPPSGQTGHPAPARAAPASGAIRLIINRKNECM